MSKQYERISSCLLAAAAIALLGNAAPGFGQDHREPAAAIAAAVPAALEHLRGLVPAGPVALDTSYEALAGALNRTAALLRLDVTALSDVRVCDNRTLRCRFRESEPSAVVIKLQGINGAPPLRLGTTSGHATMDLHWEYGPPGDRRVAGRTVEVELLRTATGWRAGAVRVLYEFH
jgi:hypothetical protein